MTHLTFSVTSDVRPSERLDALDGAFGYSAGAQAAASFSIELPPLDEPWTIGAIVGPSGSGKSLAAAHAFPHAWRVGQEERQWPRDRAIVDALGERPIEEVTAAFGSVGLNSVPAWTRPFHALSGGERFRAELAAGLLSSAPVIVADEFTSTLDRQLAETTCRAIARRLRSTVHSVAPGERTRKFVAVTCHRDVLPWLAPDWVLDMGSGRLSRRRLRRSAWRFHIHACHRREWRMFREHHYLNDRELPSAAECYVVVRDGGASAPRPAVAFISLLSAIGMKKTRRISRLVVLPSYQGLGLGRRLADWVGARCQSRGLATRISTAHPAMLAALSRSEHWRLARRARCREHTSHTRWTRARLLGRTLTTYVFIGGAAPSPNRGCVLRGL